MLRQSKACWSPRVGEGQPMSGGEGAVQGILRGYSWGGAGREMGLWPKPPSTGAQGGLTRRSSASLDHADSPAQPRLLGTWLARAASPSPLRAFPKWPQLPRGSAHFLDKT